MRSRVQRQLSRLQRPDFITALEVVAVDPGGAAPTLRNIRALPQPEASIWPQVLFDMRYQGEAASGLGPPGIAALVQSGKAGERDFQQPGEEPSGSTVGLACAPSDLKRDNVLLTDLNSHYPYLSFLPLQVPSP